MATVEMQHIAKYLLSLAENSDLLVNLNDHTIISAVVEHQRLSGNFETLGGSENLNKSGTQLKGRVTYIVVEDDVQSLGIIAKAHRCY